MLVKSIPSSAVYVGSTFDGFFKQFETSKFRYMVYNGIIDRIPLR